MTEAIGMPAADLAAFRADPIWPLRVAAAPTILRELDAAEHDPAAGARRAGRRRRPGAAARRVAVAGRVPHRRRGARRPPRARPSSR